MLYTSAALLALTSSVLAFPPSSQQLVQNTAANRPSVPNPSGTSQVTQAPVLERRDDRKGPD